jgi:hypothetical protein
VFTVKTPKHLLSLLQQKIIYSIEIALKVWYLLRPVFRPPSGKYEHTCEGNLIE